MKPITFIPASLYFDASMYAKASSHLLRDAFEHDPTVIPHTFDEMLQKFSSSVIALLDNVVVWQASIYPTSIPEFLWSQEIGSVVVRSQNFGNSIGHMLVRWLIHHYGNTSQSIISATVNPRMYPIFEKNGFEQIPFPPLYLEEGKQYLAPKMVWGETEFLERARCYYRD